MKFKAHCEIQYQVLLPTTFIFNIQVSKSSSQTVIDEKLDIDPSFPLEEFTSNNGDVRFLRIQVNEPGPFKIHYEAIVDHQYQVIEGQDLLKNDLVSTLDAGVIPYLFPSRYCQSDKLQELVFREFGKIDNTFAKVSAIAEWVYENVSYKSGITNSSTSALDTLTERAGVCRDFAHLAIALCRALSIPARYCTGYAYNLKPPDFHACFEAYIGGEWMFFDPTKMVPVNGLVKIGNGRDAADAAVASIFGKTDLLSIQVGCESLDPDFKPFYVDKATTQKTALSYQ